MCATMLPVLGWCVALKCQKFLIFEAWSEEMPHSSLGIFKSKNPRILKNEKNHIVPKALISNLDPYQPPSNEYQLFVCIIKDCHNWGRCGLLRGSNPLICKLIFHLAFRLAEIHF